MILQHENQVPRAASRPGRRPMTSPVTIAEQEDATAPRDRARAGGAGVEAQL